MPDDIRVALIGYGLGGATFHAPLIASTPGLSLGAVLTRDVTRRETLRRDFPGVRALRHVDELIADAASFDLVVVASPNATHESFARRALEVGLHVVVDKPFAATAAGARALIELANARGRLIIPFQNRRWDGDFLTVTRLIAEGRLGSVFRFESRMERWRPTPRPRWTTAGAAEGAEGIIYDLGSHLVDQALVLFGPARRVYAEAERQNPSVTVDDESFIAITHASGVRSHVVVSTQAAIAGPRMSVFGSRATFVKLGVDPQEEQLKAGRRPGDATWGNESEQQWGVLNDGSAAAPVPTERGAYERFYAGVARALLEGAAPPVDPWDAVRSLGVLEAAHQSAASGEVVKVSDATFGGGA